MSDNQHNNQPNTKTNGIPGAKKPTLPPGMKPAGPKAVASPSMPPAKPGVAPARPAGLPANRNGKPASIPVKPGPVGNGVPAALTRKDFMTDSDVRWCPGCGDYAILATLQRLMPELGIKRENQVFVSGIGCSSRFPYYMNTYGLHSIHGRAPAIATGLKVSRPELDVWIITGDGDLLSIGGNHLIHLMRRNVDIQLLLFNNQIYGLTKGQYSPTSEVGKVTKSTPYGSIDHPFNPLSVALGADASFVARTMDRDPKHLHQVLKRAYEHKGSSFVEIYQNCVIFNDGAFFEYTEKDSKMERVIFVEHGRPATFDGGRRGIHLNGLKLEVIDLQAGDWSLDDCLVYDETSREMAQIFARCFWQKDLPRPFGVLYRENRPTYEASLHAQIDAITQKRGKGSLDALLESGDTWVIE